jgi:hypothetical protein
MLWIPRSHLPDTRRRYLDDMSYNVSLRCGCQVYVSCHPRSGVAHTRVIEFRSQRCAIRSHDVGVRIPAWELLRYEPDEQGEVGATVASGALARTRR